MRTKHYDYDAWLRQGYYLRDYDFETEEFVLDLLANIETITPKEASAMNYANAEDLTEDQIKMIMGKDYEPEG